MAASEFLSWREGGGEVGGRLRQRNIDSVDSRAAPSVLRWSHPGHPEDVRESPLEADVTSWVIALVSAICTRTSRSSYDSGHAVRDVGVNLRA